MNLRRKISFVMIFAVIAVFVAGGCSADDNSKTSVSNASPTKTPLSELERGIKSLRTVDFDYIFLFKRKDGEAFSSEDKKFLKAQTYIANRRSLLKDEKTILIGSNYEIEKKRLDALKKRFDFEDFSKPPEKRKKEKPDSNSNVKSDQKKIEKKDSK